MNSPTPGLSRGTQIWRPWTVSRRVLIVCTIASLFEFWAAGAALFKVVGELNGVLGGVALQLSRIGLDRRSVHTENHRYLRQRLPRAAF